MCGLFALYALISGVFLAANTNLVLDKASTVLQLLSLIVATITIVYVSKEVKWNFYLLFFAPVLLLIILIYNGELKMFLSASDLS